MSTIQVTPISGSDPHTPYCTLIHLDTITVLVDCGLDVNDVNEHGEWNSTLLKQNLVPHLHTIDAILLTHATINHIGALLWLLTQYSVELIGVPVYATIPVCTYGKLLHFQLWQEYRHRIANFSTQYYNDEDVRTVYDTRIQMLKYSQPQLIQKVELRRSNFELQQVKEVVRLRYEEKVLQQRKAESTEDTAMEDSEMISDSDNETADQTATATAQPTSSEQQIDDSKTAVDEMDSTNDAKAPALFNEAAVGSAEITAYAAGHTIGGTVWRIASTEDTSNDIVVATDWSLVRDQHLSPTALQNFYKPAVLITDAYNMSHLTPKRKQRDTLLIQSVTNVVKAGGSVLLPSDASGRILELMFLLHTEWQELRLDKEVPLVLLSSQAYYVLYFARGLLEWMSADMTTYFDELRDSPFAMKYMRSAHTFSEFQQIVGQKPFVCIAPHENLECGMGMEVLKLIADDPKSMLLVTQRQPVVEEADKVQQPYVISQVLSHLPSTCLSSNDIAQYKPYHSDSGLTIQYLHQEVIDLTGDELDEWHQHEGERTEIERLERGDDGNDVDDATAEQAMVDTDSESDDDLANDVRGGDLSKPLNQRRQSSAATTGEMGYHVTTDTVLRSRTSFPIFSYIEPKRTADAYGEPLHTEEIKRLKNTEAINSAVVRWDENRRKYGRGFFGNQQAAQLRKTIFQSVKEEPATAEDDLNEPAATPAIAVQRKVYHRQPQKTVVSTATLTIKCGVMYIDLEGRSDGNAQRRLLKQIEPQQLIAIHGAEADKQVLRKYCDAESVASALHTPSNGETVTISSGADTTRVALHDQLFSTLQWAALQLDANSAAGVAAAQAFGANGTTNNMYEVAWLDAVISDKVASSRFPTLTSVPTQPLATANKLQASTQTFNGHNAVLIGEVKLPEVRRTLLMSGIPTEFVEGILVCYSGMVQVRQNDKHRLQIVGTLSEEYFNVRSVLYGSFKIV